MKILIVHNAYKFKGGEDSVVEQEYKLLKSNGVSVETLKFNNDELPKNKLKLFASSIYNTVSYKRVHKKLSSFKPDVIHIHNLFYAASPSILYAAKTLGIPVVMTVHNYRLICNAATLLRDGEICEKCIEHTFPVSGIKNACFQDSRIKSAQLTLITSIHKLLGTWENKISTYIFLTPFAKTKMQKSSLSLKNEQCIIKPNFCNDYGISSSENRENYFLFVGRLSKEKGVDTLIKSFIENKRQIRLIGEGPLKDSLISETKKCLNITFLGSKDKNEVIHQMKKCQALIFPSIWNETFGMVIIEAFSTGTPVICSKIIEKGGLINEGKNGLLFETNSSESLSQVIRNFDRDNNRDQLYIGARKSYEEKYTSERNYEMLMTTYKETIRDYKNAVN